MALAPATRLGDAATRKLGRPIAPPSTQTAPGVIRAPENMTPTGTKDQSSPGRVSTTVAPIPNYAGSIGGGAVATQPAAPATSSPAPSPIQPGTAGGGLAPPARSPRVQMEDMGSYVPGEFLQYPGNAGRYLVDPYGNFLEGSADQYVRDQLGSAPTQAPVDPTMANSIENQYLQSLAGYDASDAYTNQAYTDQQGYIDRNKTKSLTSLADSMADRGLTNSGIFFGQTGEVNNAALEQLSAAGRSRDQMLSQNQSGRVNAGTDRANALAQAQADALAAAIQSWQDRYNAEIQNAAARQAEILRNAGLG